MAEELPFFVLLLCISPEKIDAFACVLEALPGILN